MSPEYTCRAPRTASPRFTTYAISTPITPTHSTMTAPSRANTSVGTSALDTPLPMPAVSATTAEAHTSLRNTRRSGERRSRFSPAPDIADGNGSAAPITSSSAEINGRAAK